MSDDFSDWGDYEAAAPKATGGVTTNPFADWGDPETEAKAKADEAKGMNWTDTVKNVTSGIVGDVGALATAGQVAAERAGYPTIAQYAKETSTDLHDLSQQVEESMSPAARKSRDAALIKSNEDQEQLGAHPLRQLAMKGSGIVAPGAVGAAGGVLGGIIGSAIGPEGTVAGAAYGSAAAGAAYGLVKGVDQAVAWTNKLTDEQLEKEAPVFSQFKKMYLEQGMTPEKASYEARVGLHEGLYGIGQAAMDAGTNALAFGAGRKILTGAFGEKKLVDYALSGSSLGAASASGDVNQQNVENVKSGTNTLDLGRTAIAFINGTAEGLAFHGAGERTHALINWIKAKPDQSGESSAAGVTNQSAATASTGVAPKTTRADTQPPPNEAAQEGVIGNTVNPPVRDQGAKGEAVKDVGRKRLKPGIDTEVSGSVTTNEVAPDQIQALKDSTAGSPDAVVLAQPKAESPIPQPAPVEVSKAFAPEPIEPIEPTVEPVKSDNIPEAPPTIDAQIDALANKQRKFVRFEDVDQVPDADRIPDGVQEHEAPDGSVWWYRASKPRAAIENKINSAIEGKTENELLGLGAHNKEAVAQSVAEGAEPAAVVARTPEGTEVAAAASTDQLAPETIEAVKAANPEAEVTAEAPNLVAEGRLNGTGKPSEQIEIARNRLNELSSHLPSEEAVRSKMDAAAQEAKSIAGFKEREPVSEAEEYSRNVKLWGKERADKLRQPEAPRESVASTGRILDITTPEQKAAAERAQAELDAQRAAEAKLAAQREKAQNREAAKPGETRRKLGPEALNERQKNLDLVKEVVNAHPEAETETREQTIDRARRLLKAAEERGAEIPGTLPDNATGPQGVLREAADLIRHVDKPGKNGVDPMAIHRFVRQDKLFRGNDEDIALAKEIRRSEAAAVNGTRIGKKDEQIETGRASTQSAKIDVPTEIKGVRQKNGKTAKWEVAEAKEGRKVSLTPEQIAEIEARANAAPKTKAEVKVNDLESEDVRKFGDREEAPTQAKKSKSRSFEDDDFTRAFFAAEKEGRDTGEREGHVSYGYGGEAASASIGRTAKVRDVFAKEVLQHTNTKGLFGTLFRHMRGKLVDVVGDVQVHFVSAEDMAAIHENGSRAKGFYKEKANGEGGYIVMREGLSKEEMAHVFTHEALHAATSDALSSSEHLTKQVRSIMDEVKRSIPEIEKTYGFKDEHEFIAEAFSNKEFQDQLARTKVSPELAKALGMPEARGQSVWRAMVRAIQKALGFEPGSMSALEAVLRPTSEAMERYGVEGGGRQHSLTMKERKENLLVGAKKALRSLGTTTMIANRAARLGKRFGEYARRADDIYRRMTAYREEHLQKFGGDELIRRGDELRNSKPEALAEGSAIADRANILRVDPTKDDAWHDRFFGKDRTKWWQAKAKLKDLRNDWDAFKAREPEVAKFIEDGARWGSKALERQTEQRVHDYLDAADLHDPALAARILKAGKVPDADKPLFSSDTFIEHIDRIVAEGKHPGWYFHLTRDGDYVVTARREFDVSSSPYVARVGTDRVIFTDPTGKGGNMKARREAEKFVINHKAKPIVDPNGNKIEADYLPHNDTNKIWVDKNDITKELDKSDVNSIPAYRVTLQDKFMSKYKTAGEARTAVEELKAAGWSDVRNPEVSRLSPFARAGSVIPSQIETMLNSMRNRDKFKNLDPAQKAEMIAAMHQTAIKMMPGMRFQQTRLQRQNVAGYSKSIVESLGRSIQMDAGYSARMKFATQLKEAVDNMRDYIKSRNDKFNLERSEIARDLEDRFYAGQEFGEPDAIDKVINFLNKLSMVTKLVGPSQPLMNASEVGVVAVPVLAREHGMVKAVRAVKDAYKAIGVGNVSLAGVVDMARATTKNSGFTSYRDLIQQNILNSGIEGGKAFRYIDVIDHLHDVNLLNHEAGMEVQRLLQDRPSNIITKTIDRADIMFRQVNQAIEAINRSVTGLAAYELAYSKNKNHFSALRAAQDAVHDTMGDYSAANAPPVFNSMFGKTALQFKKYGQKTYALVGKLLGDSLRGDREAQKAFFGVMLTHGLMAGALGLPGLELVKAATAVTGVLGGPSYTDFQAWVRQRLDELVGETAGMAIARGVPRAAGVDLAGRMSSDSFVLPMDNPKSTREIPAWLGNFLAGAPGSLPVQTLGMIKGFIDQDLGAAAKAGPFKAVRDIYNAINNSSPEGIKDASGRTKIPALSGPEALVQALGFTPGRIAESREKQNTVYEKSQSRDLEIRKLKNAWVGADASAKADALKAIQKFNDNLPPEAVGARITMKDLTSLAKSRRTEKVKGTYVEGMRVTKRNRDIVQKAMQTYGD